jgi:sigma-B regulation protein RsbQ
VGSLCIAADAPPASMNVIERNNVRQRGAGSQAMVFAHGFGCDQHMWRLVAPEFECDHRVVLFDYVGAGGSQLGAYDTQRYATLDGYAQDLLDVIEATASASATVVAHSVSSMVAVLAARRAPGRIGRLVLIGPSPRYVNEPPSYVGGFDRADIEGLLDLMERNHLGWAAALAPAVMKNADRPALTEELERSFCAMEPEIGRRFARVTFLSDNRADLSQVRVPTLILQCADDAIAPDAVGQFVHQQIAGSALRRMQATGHCPHMSHPDETVALIRAWLDGEGR